MLEIMGWVYGILAIVFFVHAVIWNTISLFQAIKKYRFLKQNWSLENYLRYYFEKYYDYEVPTNEDIQILTNYLKELKE